MKTKLKVLPTKFWMEWSNDADSFIRLEDTLECAKEIAPILNRNGYYFDRASNKCWFEWNGKAFVYSVSSFKYELLILNHNPLSDLEVSAIETLNRRGIKNKELNELMHVDGQWKQLRDTYRSSRMHFMRVVREL